MAKKEKTQKQSVRVESMEELVFAKKNKEYGAYDLRKRYSKHVVIAFFIGLFILSVAVSKPLYEAYQLQGKHTKKVKKKVTAIIENIKQDEEPPPPPPPPPPAAIEQQVKFTAPVVVDEEIEEVELATADEMSDMENEAPPEEITVVEDTKDEIIDESQEEGVWFVEENATFQGGDLNTFSVWVGEHIQYPAQASEAGITGKVIVQFSVGRDGTVMNAKVIRSVHPSLDNEAIRVILSSPRWQPAKQSGNPVKQNYVVPIVFTLQ